MSEITKHILVINYRFILHQSQIRIADDSNSQQLLLEKFSDPNAKSVDFHALNGEAHLVYRDAIAEVHIEKRVVKVR